MNVRTTAMVAFALTLNGCGPISDIARDPFSDVQDAVKSQLKDPMSAQFSEITRCGNSGYIIGKVNAKNSFGGYTGGQRFAYYNGEVAMAGDEDERLLLFMKNCTAAIGSPNK